MATSAIAVKSISASTEGLSTMRVSDDRPAGAAGRGPAGGPIPPASRGRGNFLLGYAIEANLTTKLIAHRFVILVVLTVLLPVPACLLFPRTGEVAMWAWGVAAAGVVLIVAIGLGEFRRLAAADEYLVPSLWRLEAEVVLGVVSFGFFAYGIGADPNPISYTLLMPVVIVAALGNLRMTAVTWVVSLGVVVGLLAATGAGAGLVVRMGLFYGMASGVIALIIQVVVSAAFTALSEHRQVAEVAEVAARADDLATGLDQILPLMCAHVGGPAATAHRVAVPGGAVESLAACPRGADPGIDDDRLAEAARSAGISLDGHRAFLVVPESGGSVVLVAMDLGPAARHGRWGDLFKVELRLLLVQLENLVKRTHSLEQLHRMTRTDALTGLPNRRALFEELGARFQADTAGVRPRPGMVAAMLDLDDFKDYNDTFGHLGGDQALRMFARSIHEAKRTSDFVARFGGEEFCVLLADADERRALRWLERCRHAVAASPPDGGPLTFSAGVATWDGRESADELLRRADAALYDAKAAGKDRSIVAMGSGRAGPHTPPRGTTLRTPP